MTQPFLGQITLYPYTFAPKGWADCAGQLMSISQNTALFSLLGTNFGGDGRSTFGLPDLRGRVGVHQGTGPGLSDYVLGELTGSEGVQLNTSDSPVHNHAMYATTANGTTNSPAGNLLASPLVGNPRGGTTGSIYNVASPTASLANNAIGQVGGTQPHNNLQPFLTLRYCIAITGIFPQRP